MKHYIRYTDTGEIAAVITTTDPNLIVDDCIEISGDMKEEIVVNQKEYEVAGRKIKKKPKKKDSKLGII